MTIEDLRKEFTKETGECHIEKPSTYRIWLEQKFTTKEPVKSAEEKLEQDFELIKGLKFVMDGDYYSNVDEGLAIINYIRKNTSYPVKTEVREEEISDLVDEMYDDYFYEEYDSKTDQDVLLCHYNDELEKGIKMVIKEAIENGLTIKQKVNSVKVYKRISASKFVEIVFTPQEIKALHSQIFQIDAEPEFNHKYEGNLPF